MVSEIEIDIQDECLNMRNWNAPFWVWTMKKGVNIKLLLSRN